MKKDEHGVLVYELVTVLSTRININMAFRMTYPFLPVISRGLGVPFGTSGLLITVRSLSGLSGLFFGPLGDRIGHRSTMLLGIALFGLGTVLLASFSVFWIALIAFGIIGIAKAAYDPAMQAHMSARVPYSARASILGITELSWAGGWLVGVPISGFMIGHFGWQSPWMVMAAAALPTLFLTLSLARTEGGEPEQSQTWFRDSIVSFVKTPPILSVLVMSFLIQFANEQFLVVYGAWMEHAFGLGPIALGSASIVIGFSELCGELGVILFTDRFGKARSLILGIASTAVLYIIVALLGDSLHLALLGLAVLLFAYEFTIVSSIVFLSELVPEKRNTMMASFFAAATAGRAFGAICGPRLWGATEYLLIQGVVSIVAMIVALSLGAPVLLKETAPRS